MNSTSTLQHLYKFCDVLEHDPSSDSKPRFSFAEDDAGNITATALLPSYIPLQVRHISSRRAWRTERAAKRDAAFHAYEMMYKIGLLNEHLLPICEEWDVTEGPKSSNPDTHTRQGLFNPWVPDSDVSSWFKMELRLQPSNPVSTTAFEPKID